MNFKIFDLFREEAITKPFFRGGWTNDTPVIKIHW